MGHPSILAIVLLCIGLLVLSPVHALGSSIGTDQLANPVARYEPADSTSPSAARAIATDGWKSPGRAFLYSSLGTVIPVGVGGAAALGQNELTVGSYVAIVGAVVGPSLGHFYAQRNSRAIRGIVIRGVATAIVAATVTSDNADNGSASLFVGALLVGTTCLVVDIAGAPYSARAHNQTVGERVGLSVAPLAGSISGAPGVGVRLAY
jgi:hypothetical protein